MRTLALALLLGGTAALIAGCTTDGVTGTNGTGGGSITLTLGSGTISIVQGANGTVDITITRAGGFSGAVNLTVQGAPTGVTATIQPSALPAGVTAAVLGLAVGASVAPGSHTLTISATGQGVTQKTATVTITVIAGAPPDFSLSLSVSTLQLVQGAQADVTVNLQRVGGFNGAVALTAGAPNGLTVTFNPASASGSSSVATISAASGLAPGIYTVAIRGDATTGLPQKSVDLAVTVTASGGGGSITWQFCPAWAIPVWFAYQDGSGAWTQVQPSATQSYSFNLGSGRGGVAFTIIDNADVLTSVFFGTTAELTAIGTSLCTTYLDANRTINGTLAGVGQLEQAYVALGLSAGIVAAGTANFTLEDVPPGPVDLFAGRAALVVAGSTPRYELNSLVIRRDLDPTDGSTLPVVDFNGAEAIAPVQRNVTINNLGADIATVLTGYVTGNGATGDFYHDFLASNLTTRTWGGVPAAQQQSDDLHVLTIATSPTAGFATRSAARYFRDAVDQTLTLGPALGNVTLTNVAGAPYSRTRVQYTIQSGYDDQYLIVLGTGGNAARGFLINVTAGWLAGATELDVTTPDLSGTGGWNNAWGIPFGMQASWTLRAAGWTGTGGILTAPFIEGTETIGALRGGLYTS